MNVPLNWQFWFFRQNLSKNDISSLKLSCTGANRQRYFNVSSAASRRDNKKVTADTYSELCQISKIDFFAERC